MNDFPNEYFSNTIFRHSAGDIRSKRSEPIIPPVDNRVVYPEWVAILFASIVGFNVWLLTATGFYIRFPIFDFFMRPYILDPIFGPIFEWLDSIFPWL